MNADAERSVQSGRLGDRDRHSTLVLVDVDGVINALGCASDRLASWPVEMWREALIDLPSGPGTLRWSSGVIEGLREIEHTPGVTMRWCTTWGALANEILAPFIGIGHHWRHEPQPPVEDSAFTGLWKADCVEAALHNFDRVAWVDDDIASWVQLHRMAGAELPGWISSPRLLTITTNSNEGLTSAGLDALRRWLSRSGA